MSDNKETSKSGEAKSPKSDTANKNTKAESIKWVVPGDIIKGHVPKMENPPPPPKEKE